MSRMMKTNWLKAGLISGALVACAMNGCVGYNVYPPEVGTGGFSDPSSPPLYQLMTQSLRWAVKKYPPGNQVLPTSSDVPIPPSEAEAIASGQNLGASGEARVAISLFSAMRPDVYRFAVSEIGQGAVPLTPESEHLPRYMVSRVWVLGDEAKVDILRPVSGTGTDGGALYQPITVNLRGGMKYWRVTAYRVWSIGTIPPPAPEYLGGSTVIPEPATPEPEGVPADGDDMLQAVPADAMATPAGEENGAPSDPM